MPVVNPNQIVPPNQFKVLPATGAPTRLKKSPLSPTREGRYTALAATKVFGSNGPALSNEDAFIRHFVTETEAGGGKVLFDSNQFPALLNAFVDGGTLIRDNHLRVVVEVNGVPIIHVASGGVVGAGEFDITDNASVIECEFGTAYGAGTKLEWYINSDTDVIVLNQNVDFPANQFVQENLFLHLLAEDQIVNVAPVAGFG